LTVSHPDQCYGAWGYFLDAWEDEVCRFTLYRERIIDQLSNNEDFFRDRLLDVLRWYPGLAIDGFRIRISINIDQSEIKVYDVALEADKDFQRKEQKLGFNIILAYKAYYPSQSNVRFDVTRRIWLEEEKLPKMEEGHEMSKDVWEQNGAHEIADALSDSKPEMGITWQITPDLYSKVERPRHRKPITRFLRMFSGTK
jgi:hypothetical protein